MADNIRVHEISSPEPMEIDVDQLGYENEILKTLLSNLHKLVTSNSEINDSPCELPCALKPDPRVDNAYRQAQDIYHLLKKTKETERYMDQLGNENETLKTFLSYLHTCITSHTEINNSPFEQSSDLIPDPLVTNLYRQAQDIYNFLKETKKIESETASASMNLLELESLIIGDGEHHETVTTGRERESKDVSHSSLEQIESQKERFQRALSVLKQLKQSQKECQKLRTRSNGLEERLSEKDKDMNTLNKGWQDTYIKLQQEMERKLQQKDNDCKLLTQEHAKEKEQLHNTVECLILEKDNLLTRLSMIAGERLTHGNVNIADLSDANRPTKLQEVYSELYDNEWTDAYQELTKHQNMSEKNAIRILLHILMCSFQKCREMTWDRYESLKCVASSYEIKKNPFLSDVKVMSDVSETGLAKVESGSTAQVWKNDAIEDQRFGCTVELDFNLEKQIKDIWRTTSLSLKENAIKQLPSVIETCLDIPCRFLPMTSTYLSKCIDLCWKMGVQEKPLHLDCVAEKSVGGEKRFDKERFRPYTHSGGKVDFVVWPVLFLFEGGPMLVKGIAQGCSSDERKTATYV